MTPPRTIVGTLAHARGLNRPWTRRAIFGALIAVFLVLGFYPQRYRAAVSLTPSDPSSLGLNVTLSQLGALNSVFGNQAAIEMALKVAGSVQVRDAVAKKLDLQDKLGLGSKLDADRWLEREVDIRAIRGGIIQVQVLLSDSELGRQIVAAYEEATRAELARINRSQTAYKRDVLLKLVTDASDRLAVAQSSFDTFRLSTRNPDPTMEVGAASARLTDLEQAIKRKELELSAARQFYTDDNMKVQQLVTELAGLRVQLAQAQTTTPEQSLGVGRAVRTSTEFKRLQRELNIAQSMYDSYMHLLENTSVDDMTSNANVRVLEPAYVDTARQYNYPPLAVALALMLLLLSIEFYSLRPPVGDRIVLRQTHA